MFITSNTDDGAAMLGVADADEVETIRVFLSALDTFDLREHMPELKNTTGTSL